MKKFSATLLALTMIFFAEAQNRINILNRDIFVGSSSNVITKNKEYRVLMEINYLNAIYRQNPSITADDARRELQEFSDFLKSQTDLSKKNHSLREYVSSAKDLVGSGTKLVASKGRDIISYTQFFFSIYDIGMNIYDDYTNPSAESKQNVIMGSVTLEKNFKDEILGNAYTNSKNGSTYGEVFNQTYSGFFNYNTNDSFDQILSANPDYKSALSIRDILDKLNKWDNNISAQKQLNDYLTLALDDVKSQMEESNKLLGDFQKEQQAVAEMNRREKMETLRNEAMYDSFQILSHIAFFVGEEKLAKSLSVLGTTAIDIKNSIDKFKYISNNFKGDETSTFSHIILTENIMSAVINIFQLFSNTPSFESQVLDKLNSISSQIDTMYYQMHRRFDMVDIRLEKIYELIRSGFEKIITDLGYVKQNLHDLQVSMISLTENLNNFSTLALTDIKNNSYQNLLLDLGKINRPDNNLTTDEQKTLLANMNTYASQISYMNSFSQIDFNNADIVNTLLKNEENYALPELLENILSKNYGFGRSAKSQPDLLMWVLASNGILELKRRYPKLKIPNDYVENVITGAENILLLQRSLKSASINGKDTIFPIFDKVVNDYIDNTHHFIKTCLLSTEADYINTKFNGRNPFKTIPDDSLDKKVYLYISDFIHFKGPNPHSYLIENEYSEFIPSWQYDYQKKMNPVMDSLYLYKMLPRYYRYLSTLNLGIHELMIDFSNSNEVSTEQRIGIDVYTTNKYERKDDVLEWQLDFWVKVKSLPLFYRFIPDHSWAETTYGLLQGNTIYSPEAQPKLELEPFHIAHRSTLNQFNSKASFNNLFITNLYSGQNIFQKFNDQFKCYQNCLFDSVIKASLYNDNPYAWQEIYEMVNRAKRSIYDNDLNKFSESHCISHQIGTDVDRHYNTLKALIKYCLPSSENDDSLNTFFYGPLPLYSSENIKYKLNKTIARINNLTDYKFPPDSKYKTEQEFLDKTFIDDHNYKWWMQFSSSYRDGGIKFRDSLSMIIKSADKLINENYIPWEKDFDDQAKKLKYYLYKKLMEEFVSKEKDDLIVIENILHDFRLLKQLKR